MNTCNTLNAPLLEWFNAHGRHDLPWQHPRTPYRVWISEIMLQQTQVTTVIPYFERFVSSFPTVRRLAEAPLDSVLQHWAGLGYYARARNLHRAANFIVNQHNGELPADLQALQNLAGVGRSTAGAIMAQGYNQRAIILDGNVKRVLARYEGLAGWPGSAEMTRKLWQYAEFHTPFERVVDYTQAIMDLGATVCRRNKPFCTKCPLAKNCKALLTGRTQELPTRKQKKQIPIIQRYVLVEVMTDGQIYLERRPESGIWGGLYSFPESQRDVNLEEAIAEFENRYQFALTEFNSGEPINHSFTHFKLILKPIMIRHKTTLRLEESTGKWFRTPVDHVGLPAPIQKWLSQQEILKVLPS